MYIPEQVLWFLLGFIAFPIFVYALWEFWLKKKEVYEDSDNKKSSNGELDEHNKNNPL